MSEERREIVTPVRVQLFCGCGTEMKFGGIIYDTNPPKYPYLCPACGSRETVSKNYPYIEYESADYIVPHPHPAG